MRIGFDNALYMSKQKAAIEERIRSFKGKLYLEFGGKLFDDYHAARVLPGFEANAKVRLLQEFRDQAEIVFCINASDIGNKKIRADLGLSYDMDLLRLIDQLRHLHLYVSSVVITQFNGQPEAERFAKMLDKRGEHTYFHYPIQGYPMDVNHVVSEEGYGKNDYIKTTRPLVVITAPGPCSGKLATCLSQLYHEQKRGVRAGYAKFETFPVWNLPLRHPVNLAYEAATADLRDVNMIDPYHLEAYNVTTVNYNRDVEAFPVLRTILSRVMDGAQVYKSPTDMGVNMAGYGIFDDEAVREAACQEIIRRYYRIRADHERGRADDVTLQKIEMIMKQMDLSTDQRKVVAPALEKMKSRHMPAMAIELEDGTIVTGRGSTLMNAAAAAVLNAIKQLAGISDDIYLLSPIILGPIMRMKRGTLGIERPVLSLDEVLLALGICAATNTMVELAVNKLAELKNCEAHASYMLPTGDERTLAKLGINVTCEPIYQGDELYQP